MNYTATQTIYGTQYNTALDAYYKESDCTQLKNWLDSQSPLSEESSQVNSKKHRIFNRIYRILSHILSPLTAAIRFVFLKIFPFQRKTEDKLAIQARVKTLWEARETMVFQNIPALESGEDLLYALAGGKEVYELLPEKEAASDQQPIYRISLKVSYFSTEHTIYGLGINCIDKKTQEPYPIEIFFEGVKENTLCLLDSYVKGPKCVVATGRSIGSITAYNYEAASDDLNEDKATRLFFELIRYGQAGSRGYKKMTLKLPLAPDLPSNLFPKYVFLSGERASKNDALKS